MSVVRRIYSYQFTDGEKPGGIRMFDNNGIEVTPNDIEMLIEGLTKEYLTLSEEEKKNRLIASFEKEFDSQYSHWGPLYDKKPFRKDLKRNWSFQCTNCEEKISSKTHEEYYYASLTIKDWYGLRFCSEWCAEKYHSELKADYIKKRKVEHGLWQK